MKKANIKIKNLVKIFFLSKAQRHVKLKIWKDIHRNKKISGYLLIYVFQSKASTKEKKILGLFYQRQRHIDFFYFKALCIKRMS